MVDTSSIEDLAAEVAGFRTFDLPRMQLRRPTDGYEGVTTHGRDGHIQHHLCVKYPQVELGEAIEVLSYRGYVVHTRKHRHMSGS